LTNEELDAVEVEIWWNDYELEDEPNLDPDKAPICITIYKNRDYLDYYQIKLTKEEELQLGILPSFRDGFSEWMSGTHFLSTQNLSPRIMGWAIEKIGRFTNG
jgi:hypothetical protein